MTAKLIRVRASRAFGAHAAGDELLVGDSADVAALVKAGLFELLAIETPAPVVPTAALFAQTKPKPKADNLPPIVIKPPQPKPAKPVEPAKPAKAKTKKNKKKKAV